jgi:hypothetical protein
MSPLLSPVQLCVFFNVGMIPNGMGTTKHCCSFTETAQERPYVMLNHGKNYTGNNRFYGFSMELLDEIARISKFSYIVDINPDGAYGVKNPVTGEWNGVVKQLMSHVSSNQPTNLLP